MGVRCGNVVSLGRNRMSNEPQPYEPPTVEEIVVDGDTIAATPTVQTGPV